MSPIYWGTFAPEMETILRKLDFLGKNVRVLSTHEGSCIANMLSDVKRIFHGAKLQSCKVAKQCSCNQWVKC